MKIEFCLCQVYRYLSQYLNTFLWIPHKKFLKKNETRILFVLSLPIPDRIPVQIFEHIFVKTAYITIVLLFYTIFKKHVAEKWKSENPIPVRNF